MMFLPAWAFLMVALVGADSDYHDPNFSGNHGVIVHLFEWKWNDIALECERFLGPKGFGGVQVSPPNENLMVPSRDRPWWERYQPISYKLITRSGNEAEFGDMCKRCNAAGVRIYVDAIINHMTGTWVENIGTGGSLVTFAEWDFPGVPYTKADFNQPICDIGTYHNATEVRNCQLQGLKDLNQRIPSVRTKIIDFMNHLLTLGVGGFRIDAAKHMWPEDLKVIYDSLRDLVTDQGFAPGTRPFIFQEVIDLGGEDVHREEYLGIGRVTEMRYGFNIGNLFRGNLELRKLINWGGPYFEPGGEWFFMDHKDVIVFVDNHDTQRGGLGGAPISYKMKRQYQAANAFMLAHPFGLPKVMSSFDFNNNEQGPPSDANFNTISPTINDDGSCGSGWVCEHRWPAITQMVIFRNTVGGGDVTNWWDNENNQIAFCVGKRGFAAFNNEGRVLSENLDTGMPAGTYCDIITGIRVGNDCSGKKVVVDGSGRASIEVSNDDMAMAFHVGPESNLGAAEVDTTTTSTTTTTQNPGTDPEPGCGNGMEVKATYEGATWSGCLYSN